MLVGMGTVFAFLTILVVGMLVMSAIAIRLTPAKVDEASGEEIAAITAAIAQHKNRAAN